MTDNAKTTWRRRVARWKASGETASAFGAREGIKASTLRWWSSVLQREHTSVPVRMVQLVRAPSSSRSSGVIVDLPDARARVLVEPGFDRETLSAVLQMLGSRVA
jgi:hypothetical protein